MITGKIGVLISEIISFKTVGCILIGFVVFYNFTLKVNRYILLFSFFRFGSIN